MQEKKTSEKCPKQNWFVVERSLSRMTCIVTASSNGLMRHILNHLCDIVKHIHFFLYCVTLKLVCCFLRWWSLRLCSGTAGRVLCLLVDLFFIFIPALFDHKRHTEIYPCKSRIKNNWRGDVVIKISNGGVTVTVTVTVTVRVTAVYGLQGYYNNTSFT